MVSHVARARAAMVAVLTVAVLAGCASQNTEDAGAVTPIASPSATAPRATPSGPPPTSGGTGAPVPGSTGTPGAPGSPTSPGPTGAPSVPADPAAAKALAVQACQAISGGFAADRVAAATPLAEQAAARDAVWKPLASNLEFIRSHPINPQTGAGPQQTVDDSTAVAHDCFTLAGVTVSQD